MDAAPEPRVLVIGLDPYRVPGPWDPTPVTEGIETGRARFIEHGLPAEFCLFGLDGSDDVHTVVTAALRAHRWECVVIGGGVPRPAPVRNRDQSGPPTRTPSEHRLQRHPSRHLRRRRSLDQDPRPTPPQRLE